MINCPLCGKKLDIKPEERRKYLEQLTKMRRELHIFDEKIKKIMEETEGVNKYQT